MYSTVLAGALCGVHAYLVQVEVDISTGLPGFSMVGSLSGEVREARERVQVALRNTGYEIMARRITVNLAPADVRKEGTAFDLPIAVGVLESMGYFPQERVQGILFLGELGLNGEVKPIRGALPMVREAARQGIRECILPAANVQEGAVIPGITVRGVEEIKRLVDFLQEEDEEKKEGILPAVNKDMPDAGAEETGEELDFREVRGQLAARRAAEIAAAGFHNLLMIGPPGAGKSMIARRIPGILPPLQKEESLEVSAIYSVAGMLKNSQALLTKRPFQSPHHTITQTALVGGSSIPKPGILSLSHRGVLFLDELPEFARVTLDSMRQPLEERKVHISRIQGNISYPADFMLIAAMNPCPCGYYPDRNRCTCTETDRRRYLGRVSGPILDRIDLCVELTPVEIGNLKGGTKMEGESSQELRRRVMKARERQQKRFQGTKCSFNGDMREAEVNRYCVLGKAEEQLMEQAYTAMQLSTRAYYRILKVARTIADLEGKEHIEVEQLREAICYRAVDSGYWKG